MTRGPSSDSQSIVALLLACRFVLRRRDARRRPPPAAPESDIDPLGARRSPSTGGAETRSPHSCSLRPCSGSASPSCTSCSGTNTQLLGLAVRRRARAARGGGDRRRQARRAPGDRCRGSRAAARRRGGREVAEMIESGGEGISRRALLTGAGGVAGRGGRRPLRRRRSRRSGRSSTTSTTRRGRAACGSSTIRASPTERTRSRSARSIRRCPRAGTRSTSAPGCSSSACRPTDPPPARARGWAPEGILAYSKICPHAGCAISLYRYPTYQPTSAGPAFTCPCHYSTFSPGEGGRLIFGPAGRSLPQLPLMIDAQRLPARGRTVRRGHRALVVERPPG